MQKRSCSRAAPLRVNPQGEAKGFLGVRWCVRDTSSVPAGTASRSAPKQSLGLFRMAYSLYTLLLQGFTPPGKPSGGSRRSSGAVGCVGGEDDPSAPPHEGEERRGLWFPRRKPGMFWGCLEWWGRFNFRIAGSASPVRTEGRLGVLRSGYSFKAPLEGLPVGAKP